MVKNATAIEVFVCIAVNITKNICLHVTEPKKIISLKVPQVAVTHQIYSNNVSEKEVNMDVKNAGFIILKMFYEAGNITLKLHKAPLTPNMKPHILYCHWLSCTVNHRRAFLH